MVDAYNSLPLQYLWCRYLACVKLAIDEGFYCSAFILEFAYRIMYMRGSVFFLDYIRALQCMRSMIEYRHLMISRFDKSYGFWSGRLLRWVLYRSVFF